MAGISPKLPLNRTNEDGFYGLNKTYTEMIQQNLKNLILTAPGERVMDPEFGVGLRNFLFEQDAEETRMALFERINEQINTYMPFIVINDLTIENQDINPSLPDNYLYFAIEYEVIPLGEVNLLELDL